MQVKSIAECSNRIGAFCNTLTFIKLPLVIKIFVLSIFEWPFYIGFTVTQSFFGFKKNLPWNFTKEFQLQENVHKMVIFLYFL